MTKSLCDSCANKNCRWRSETVSNDPPVMDCLDFKKSITNADKIRSMTDEELALTIMCPFDTDPELCNGYAPTCYDCTLDWLKKEADNG